MLETRKPKAKCLMELNMEGGRCWEGDCSAYEYNNLSIFFCTLFTDNVWR